jgi:hypothetical protein
MENNLSGDRGYIAAPNHQQSVLRFGRRRSNKAARRSLQPGNRRRVIRDEYRSEKVASSHEFFST